MTARSAPTQATLLLLFAGALSASPALSLAETCSVTQVTDLDPGSPQNLGLGIVALRLIAVPSE